MLEVLPILQGQRRLTGQRRIGGATLPVCHASFTGHESFPLRFAWLKKGYDGIRSDPAFFGSPQAMVVMGTGKNMVRSIRHWGLACQMWDEVTGTRGRHLLPLKLGDALLDDDGWDPYLEDEGTIWLLHWLCVTNGYRATTWSWMFSRPKGGAFTKTEVLSELEALAQDFGIRKSTTISLKRDLDVLVNSYLRSSGRRADLTEDALDCPMRLLDLLRMGTEKGAYELTAGPRESLPDGIFLAVLLDYLRNVRQGDALTVTFDELMYSALSPGRVLRLTEEALALRLARSSELPGASFEFDETAGLRQILLSRSVADSMQVLDAYYSGKAVR